MVLYFTVKKPFRNHYLDLCVCMCVCVYVCVYVCMCECVCVGGVIIVGGVGVEVLRASAQVVPSNIGAQSVPIFLKEEVPRCR